MGDKKKKPFIPATSQSYLDTLAMKDFEGNQIIPLDKNWVPVKSGEQEPLVEVKVGEEKVKTVPVINKKEEYLNNYKNQLKLDTASAQSEIMSANKLANQYLQNYLKQQGLVGTGLGQSQYVNLANNYANQMSQLRTNEQTRLEEESENYQNSRTKELATLLGTMNANEREKYLQEIAKTEGLDQRYLDTLATQSKLLSAQDTQTAIANIEKLIQYGASPTVIQGEIDKLKAKGVDTSSLETLMSATGSDVKTQAIDMYKDIMTALNDTNFTGDVVAYNEVKDELFKAIQSGDSNSMIEAYNKAFNLIEGVPELSGNQTPKFYEQSDFVNGAEYTAVETGGVNDYNFIHTGTGDDAKITLDGNEYDVTVVWSSFVGGNAKKYKGIDVKSYSKTLKEKYPNAKGGTIVYYDGEYWVYRKSNDAWGVIVQGDKQDEDASDAEALISKINGKISSQKNK